MVNVCNWRSLSSSWPNYSVWFFGARSERFEPELDT